MVTICLFTTPTAPTSPYPQPNPIYECAAWTLTRTGSDSLNLTLPDSDTGRSEPSEIVGSTPTTLNPFPPGERRNRTPLALVVGKTLFAR